MTEQFDFSEALKHLKNRGTVSRLCWNKSGQSVRVIYAGNAVCHGDSMRDCFGLSNGNGYMQPGWVPSTGDLFANDWVKL